jgi:hypothetical protein
LAKHNIPVVQQALYSPDMASCNFWLFSTWKRSWKDLNWVMTWHYTEQEGQAVLHSERGNPEMLEKMAEPVGEVCSVTGRLLRRGLGLQTSRRVNVIFLDKGRILFEQATYASFIFKTNQCISKECDTICLYKSSTISNKSQNHIYVHYRLNNVVNGGRFQTPSL